MTTRFRSSPPARAAAGQAARAQEPLPRDVLQAEGGLVRAGAVAKRLGVPVPVVEQLRLTGQLLAVPAAQGYHYPSWQFEGRGLLSGLPTVLQALRATPDPWDQLGFFLTPQAQLGGQRPLDLLRAGALEEVLGTLAAGGDLPQA